MMITRFRLLNMFVFAQGARPPKTNSLNGFVEIILVGGMTIHQVMYASFQNKIFSIIQEKQTTQRKIKNFYFVLGSKQVAPDMLFSDSQITSDHLEGILPAESLTYCIILLHFGHNQGQFHQAVQSFSLIQNVPPGSDTVGYLPTPINDEKMNLINEFIQDVLIVGPPCPDSECGYFYSLLRAKEQVLGEGEMRIPLSDVPRRNDGTKPYLSLSRCSPTSFPMQQLAFEIEKATPKAKNDCKQPNTKLPFQLLGVSLQATAQKLIVNAKVFFDSNQVQCEILTGNSVTKTSQILGIGERTVYQTMENYKTNSIKTPGKKRIRPTPVMDQFDDFRTEHVKRIIHQFYANNQAPTMHNVYTKLMEEVKEEEDGRIARGETLTAFKCSKWTLRKLIKQLGFRFKTVDKRAVILMRSDIVQKRYEYLSVMIKNRQSENPKCVVYTDETWVDSYARTGKGWVINSPKSFHEAALYSFQNPKISRGPRIIVMHAGGEDGFVPGAMKVYPVSKKKVQMDYHANVNGVAYMAWWKDLNQKIKDNYGPCIIVIDNAPYHSTKEAPKSTSRKQELYDWLNDNLEGPEKLKLKPVKQMRRPELWKMVQDLKNGNEYYIVDKEALKYGNTVVRLPPYNCDLNPIEYVWKDIKHAVRAANTQGTAEFAQAEAERIMTTYTKEQWQKHIKHVHRFVKPRFAIMGIIRNFYIIIVNRLEDEYWKNDGHFDDFLDDFQTRVASANPIRITAADDVSDDEDEDPDDVDEVVDRFRMQIHNDIEYSQAGEEEDLPEEECATSRRRLTFPPEST
ncbi:uncharacterized protein LOC110841924 isoform X1 [Folsomia candida]|uniref:uncharacterized protein LOC110841924 isoform X1 n=1 Tax=Folsomia candida TaxID=158441 RepID=UPI00160524AE|nr:uncharacterized protein LOC110841924 isoform X1 [Folsomia candida]XP_035716537.1 uncharacterized protein LOC110841924 isoform X1 [Folsomia candida]